MLAPEGLGQRAQRPDLPARDSKVRRLATCHRHDLAPCDGIDLTRPSRAWKISDGIDAIVLTAEESVSPPSDELARHAQRNRGCRNTRIDA